MSKIYAAVFACALAACATTTPSVATQRNLEQQAVATLNQMVQQDPSLPSVLQSSVAYAVFPSIGAGGAVVAGGAFGRGILFEHGQPTGYVELKQGSVGLELGGQTFAELVILKTPYDVEALKAGSFQVGAGATAVVLKAGAAVATRTGSSGVFIMPRGGLMAGISVNGQQIAFRPLAG